MGTYSATDTGWDTMSADETDSGSLTLAGSTASYMASELGTTQASDNAGMTLIDSTSQDIDSYGTSDSSGEIGTLSDSGTHSNTSDYDWSDHSDFTDLGWDYSITGNGGSTVGGGDEYQSHSLDSDQSSITDSADGSAITANEYSEFLYTVGSSVSDSGISIGVTDVGSVSEPFSGQDVYSASLATIDSATYDNGDLWDLESTQVNESDVNTANLWSYDYEVTESPTREAFDDRRRDHRRHHDRARAHHDHNGNDVPL